MCGICGIVDGHQHPEAELITRMTDTLRHRGPDSGGIWREAEVALGHRRLSIIDLSNAGAQPMTSACGRYVMVFNGEIYNFRDLRAELEQKSAVFRSRSDSEVLLCAFAEWGVQVLTRLNGIFAVAFWDRQDRELLLARDRFGVKPLYFRCERGARVLFGSEIKAILAGSQEPRAVCFQALHEITYFGASLGRHTCFAGTERVLPGEVVRFAHGKVQCRRFWSVSQVEPRRVSHGVALHELRERTSSAIQRQMVSDAPLGVLLSGGVDSSCIAAYASRLGGEQIQTFAVALGQNAEDLRLARLVATRFNTAHHEIQLETKGLEELVDKLVGQHDEPFGDAANLPLYLVSEVLAGQVKVVLQGDGGDEVFGGYWRYQALAAAPFWRLLSRFRSGIRWLPGASRWKQRAGRVLQAFAEDSAYRRMAWLLTTETAELAPSCIFRDDFRSQIEQTDPFQQYREVVSSLPSVDPVRAMLLTDMQILLPDVFLEKVDKAMMAHGVEARVPLLDNELAEYALSLRSEFKVNPFRTKRLFKDSLRGVVPDEVLDAPKRGFGVPFSRWLGGSLNRFARAVLLDSSLSSAAGIFDRDRLERLFHEHEAGIYDRGFLLWKALNIALWLKRYGVGQAC